MRLTRRTLLGSFGAAVLPAAPAVAAARETADPWIGTGGDGHTYPGAAMPFGMVQVSPDTGTESWADCSGYHRGAPTLMGFSHTHLSGTGIADMMDVLVVPARGPLRLDPGPEDGSGEGYRQRYAAEAAAPGRYRVTLANGIVAELSAGERVGWQRFRFPPGPGHLLIDLANYRPGRPGEAPLIDEGWLDWRDGLLSGGRRTFRWAKARRIAFALRCSRPPNSVTLFAGGAPVPGDRVAADRVQAVLRFDDAGDVPVTVRTAVSAVDAAGARANLASEPARGFRRAHGLAVHRWEDALGAVRVEGGTAAQRRTMATALYHAQLAPTLFSDADGRYRSLDGTIRTLPAGERAYSGYSCWDTYRAQQPLLTLIAPDRAQSLVRDLVRQTVESPHGPPCWPLQGIETGTMIGWHSVVMLAEAAAKGIDADYAAAWPAIRRRAFDPAGPDLANSRHRGLYMQHGYVPADKGDEAVSRTQEYAYDDWAMARIADAAGVVDDARRLRERSLNYRNVIDAGTGFARPRLADGCWLDPLDPVRLGHTPRYRDYTEANGWQATFLNQHDVHGLIAHLGGDAAFAARLDALFAAPSVLPADAPPDISGLVGQYAHGNEPDQHAPYLYVYAGQPWKTQAIVRRLCATMYGTRPDGLIGNDDCGQMSAWFALSALGLYPVDPVAAVWVLGSPLFERAELRLAGGRRLVVEAKGNGPATPYVAAVRWNGADWPRSWLPHRALAAGGRLEFTMSATPEPRFAARPADRPPSFGHVPA